MGMKHLARAGALLLGVFVLVIIGPRLLRVPAFLADFGFHQSKAEVNATEWANLPVQYANSSVCLNCHNSQYTLWQSGNHRTVNCENCHGAAAPHLERGTRPIVNTARELCGTCHAKLVSRPATFPQVDMKEMGGQAECVTCHDPHEPRAGMPPKVPHELDDRTDCQSCHNPHEPLVALPPQIPHSLEGRTDCLSCHGSNEIRGMSLPQIPHSLQGRAECLLCHNSGGIKPFPQDHAGRTSATCTNCHRSREG
ncbi:MAG: hypothetical protein HY665_05345 [Chloroflexi bacterium]|nr:hypothetical protein [Chloroflexota bacterium]